MRGNITTHGPVGSSRSSPPHEDKSASLREQPLDLMGALLLYREVPSA